MKNFIKYFLIFAAVTSVIGYVMIAVESDDAALNRRIESNTEAGNKATSLVELNKVMNEFDSIKAYYPDYAPSVDSVINANFNSWTEKVAKAEHDNMIRDAYYIAVEHIRKSLKNPSSGKFPAFLSSESNCWEEGGKIIAQFWGEGTNAFNAVVRNNYQVTMTYGANGYTIIDATSY